MPTTPLETYLRENRDALRLSQVTDQFAIGSDNGGAKNLLVGITEFAERGPTIPKTLAWSLLDSKNTWTEESNLLWVADMLKDTNMNVVHIYHQEGSDAINDGKHWDDNGKRKISLWGFQNNYRKKKGPTYYEIEAVITGGFVNIEIIDNSDYAQLRRPKKPEPKKQGRWFE